MIKKVLIVYSWNDLISKNRSTIMNNSPLLKSYKMKHVYALNFPEERIKKEKIYNRISKEIELFSPDIILLHIGTAFYNNPYVFINIFEKFKNKFSNIRFGIEKQSNTAHYYNDIDIFEESKEMAEIETLFFHTVFKRKRL